MPNWCYTQIAFFSTDENELLQFKNDIQTAIDTLPIMDREAKNWQGRVSRYFKSSAVGERGFIIHMTDITPEIYDGLEQFFFILDQEDAWAPHTEMWTELINKLQKNIGFVYRAEECGNEVYINTDYEGSFFPERYYVNTDEETEYFEDEESLLEYLKKLNHAFNGCESVRQSQYIAEQLVEKNIYDWLVIAEYSYE